MKKIISMILVFVMCMALLVGCGDSDSNSGGKSSGKSKNNSSSNAATKANGKTENSIVGSWEGDEAGETITYTFKANGTFSASYVSGTYTVSGNKITLAADLNGQEMKIFDNVSFSINGNTLKMGDYTYTKK